MVSSTSLKKSLSFWVSFFLKKDFRFFLSCEKTKNGKASCNARTCMYSKCNVRRDVKFCQVRTVSLVFPCSSSFKNFTECTEECTHMRLQKMTVLFILYGTIIYYVERKGKQILELNCSIPILSVWRKICLMKYRLRKGTYTCVVMQILE